jgi:hypothetical protein
MCWSAEGRHELGTKSYEKLVASDESGAPRIAATSTERVGRIDGHGGQDNLPDLLYRVSHNSPLVLGSVS